MQIGLQQLQEGRFHFLQDQPQLKQPAQQEEPQQPASLQ